MAQLFPRSSNALSKASIVVLGLIAAGSLGLIAAIYLSPYFTGVGVVRDQPVPFSHKHHVGGLGIDCRYCHTTVENSPFAGMPTTKTCMTCHSQIWTNANLLEPVREAYRTGQPIQWNRVHDFPHFAYFNHSIHIAKGVACITCHGPVDKMPLMYKQNTLRMGWCLECHRHPAKYIGPTSAVFRTDWNSPKTPQDLAAALKMANASEEESAQVMKDGQELGQFLVQKYHIKSRRKLTDCYVCHR